MPKPPVPAVIWSGERGRCPPAMAFNRPFLFASLSLLSLFLASSFKSLTYFPISAGSMFSNTQSVLFKPQGWKIRARKRSEGEVPPTCHTPHFPRARKEMETCLRGTRIVPGKWLYSQGTLVPIRIRRSTFFRAELVRSQDGEH